MILTDPYQIAEFIKNSEKKTPVKVYVNTKEELVKATGIDIFGANNSYILIGDYVDVSECLSNNQDNILNMYVENERRNSAIELLDLKEINARIEPGAFIRDHVVIGDNAVIMMGAVINIGAEIGAGTMIDMGAVLGARAKVGNNSHIGANAVLAGVLEPPSKQPVVVGDNVLIGANATVLEGVQIASNSVVAAGSVVIDDVHEGEVVAGIPARVIKKVDDKTKDKSEFLDDLRKL